MNKQEQDILDAFDDLKDDLSQWGGIVDEKLIKLLGYGYEGGYLKLNPEYRLKTNKSFLRKALYREKNYNKPLLNIEDKVATRAVILKSNDIYNVKSKLEKDKEWNIKVSKDTNEEIGNKPDVFNYQSLHVIVWPKRNSFGLKNDISFISCEIQIRTLLQHAFAEISHDSVYKGPFRNDNEIIRHLAKSMALMEATDDYFCDVFDILTDTQRYYYNFFKEVFDLYTKNFDSKFSEESVDYEFTDAVLELHKEKPIDSSDIKTFVKRNKKELKVAIKPENGVVFQQPIILLISYYIYNNRSFLKNNWPLSHTSLYNIFLGFGFQFEKY